MHIIKSFFNRVEEIRLDIRSMASVKELFLYIPVSTLKLSGLWLLYIWVISPIYIMVRSIFLGSHTNIDYYINRYALGINWFIILQQIGFLGFVILFILSVKKYLNFIPTEYSWFQYIKNHLVELLLFSLLIWAVISTIFSNNLTLSINGTFYRKDGLLSYIAYAGIFTCGYLLDSSNYYKKLIKLFVISATFMAFLMLINIDFINRLLTFHPNSAVFYNINHFAYYLCISIMCSALLFLVENKSQIKQIAHLICFVILIASLVKNGSFGPYIGVFAGVLFIGILLIFYEKKHLRKAIILIGAFVITSVVMNVFTGFLGIEILRLFGGIQDIALDTEIAEKAGSGRWELWLQGFSFIFEKPIFGYGPENLGARYMLEGIKQDRPHNEFIQIAASLGIPALFFYTSALLKHFYSIFKNRHAISISVVGLNAVIISYLVSSLFGNTMFYTSPFYFMMLGITISNTKEWLHGIGDRHMFNQLN